MKNNDLNGGTPFGGSNYTTREYTFRVMHKKTARYEYFVWIYVTVREVSLYCIRIRLTRLGRKKR